MPTIEFHVSNKELDRLFYLKAKAGKKELTGNEYAGELFIDLLYRLCPRTPPEPDDNGKYPDE